MEVDAPGDRVAQLQERFFAPARTRLGEGAWDEACRDGSSLSFDEAIAFALSD